MTHIRIDLPGCPSASNPPTPDQYRDAIRHCNRMATNSDLSFGARRTWADAAARYERILKDATCMRVVGGTDQAA